MGGVEVEGEGGGKVAEAGIERGGGEDPGGIGVDVEVEVGELCHGCEGACEGAVERGEEDGGRGEDEGEGADEAGEVRACGEDGDEDEVVCEGGEGEVAVEEAAGDGVEGGRGACEGDEGGGVEVLCHCVDELCGQGGQGHGGLGGAGCELRREGERRRRRVGCVL